MASEYPNRSEYEMLVDVLTDLMHFAKNYDFRFVEALRLAESHFHAESGDERLRPE